MLINKILNYFFRWDKEEKYIVQYLIDNFICTFLKIKINNNSECDYLFINLFHLCNVIITLFVFILFFIYDIKYLSDNFLEKYLLYIYIMFILFILVNLSKLIYGLYLHKYKKNSLYLKKILTVFFKWLNFLINMQLLYFFLDLEFILILQYNILFVIDNLLWKILQLYFVWLDFKLIGDRLYNFITYPWIFLLLLYILLQLKKNYIMHFIFLIKMECLCITVDDAEKK